MEDNDRVITEYRFEAFRSVLGGEVWATKIPVGDLQPEDAGALISLMWHPQQIASGERKWGTLQGVGDPGGDLAYLWIDGVEYQLTKRTEVWLGYHPLGPLRLRGGFQR